MVFITPFALGMVLGGAIAWPIVRRVQSRYRLGEPSETLMPPLSTTADEPAAKTLTQPSPMTVDVPTAVIVMDRLERIEGITPGVARRLNEVGILTYADLAAQPPEHIYAIVNPKTHHEESGVRTIAVRDWIAQARALANGLTNSMPPPAP